MMRFLITYNPIVILYRFFQQGFINLGHAWKLRRKEQQLERVKQQVRKRANHYYQKIGERVYGSAEAEIPRLKFQDLMRKIEKSRVALNKLDHSLEKLKESEPRNVLG